MTVNNKVLIVDDEEEILILLKTVLKKEGVGVIITASNALEGVKKFQEEQPDLVILDIMLPDGEGYDVCKQIRHTSNVPILFLSAKSEEIDRILGFALGGDDYITKPFSPKELAYRVKAQLRRSSSQSEKTKEAVTTGPFEWDEQTMELKKNGKVIELKPKEMRMMIHFLNHKNQIISKESLCKKVWGEDYIGFDNTIMVHIRRLREKIESQPSKPDYLRTVKGLGYKLVIKDE
ncbi:response regulator transcription factor [Bacillus sp. es.036]|uniref:response regulator transcription factor n=1 Tax=Bacillus sp. es.036 TaxID=1761764 RepID=UPI000BF4134D|nr:response regulator transcription factor [Bacillus sp. es.036]PFG14493.1 DNA-binding response OmpR family regulator [Bacillus sp. es.036]